MQKPRICWKIFQQSCTYASMKRSLVAVVAIILNQTAVTLCTRQDATKAAVVVKMCGLVRTKYFATGIGKQLHPNYIQFKSVMISASMYSGTSQQRTLWGQYKIEQSVPY